MDLERNSPMIVPTSSTSSNTNDRRHSVASTTTKFEIRKLSLDHTPSSGGATNSSFPKTGGRGALLLYRFGDLMFSMFIVFPLAIGIWRGVWQLMDRLSEILGVGPWLSIGLGYGITLAFHLFQEPLKKYLGSTNLHFIPFYLISRFLILLHTFGSINQWRGMWKFQDKLFGLEDYPMSICLCVGVLFNLVFRTFSNVLAPPMMCIVDDASVVHDCTIRFKTTIDNFFLYFLDCIFSSWIVQTFTVTCWRGLWGLADNYLYPGDEWMTTWASILIGYTITFPLTALQPLICDYVCKLKGVQKLIVLDLIYMVGFVGCIFSWRGVWGAYNLYLVFETPYLGEWVGLIICIILTVLFGCASSVATKGCDIDGVIEEEDETAEWLVPYFSHLRREDLDTPFPEPWLARLLLTNQKMNLDKLNPNNSEKEKPEFSFVPLRKMKDGGGGSCTNSNNNPNTTRLSQIPHIDSSSEESLGGRERLVSNTESESTRESHT